MTTPAPPTNDPASAAKEYEQLRTQLAANPLDAAAWRRLLVLREASPDRSGQVQASGLIASSLHHRAAQAIDSGQHELAERLLRQRLEHQPEDMEALRLLADLAYRVGYADESAALLELVLERAPGLVAARLDLARQHQQQNRMDEALSGIEEVLGRDPHNDRALYLKALVMSHLTRFEEATGIYRDLLSRNPSRARLWASLGRSLKTLGQSEEAVAAFRKSIALEPELGETWWSLSDLKTARFDDADVARMEALLQTPGMAEKDRFYFHFALGKAYEDRKQAEPSFRHYAAGNALRRAELGHDPARFTVAVERSVQTFSPEFFASRTDYGSRARDPIFILGMSRAGSTLIEQILASHPMVEGTVELPNMLAIARELAPELEGRAAAVAQLTAEEAKALGDRYIAETRSVRKTERPLFIDKMPNNWLNIPLIHLTLPNARIIDARRHPLACGFSNFRQNYARGQSFSYDLAHIGLFYRDYVRMLAHIDAVLPGRVHRVIHEQLVEDTEAEVRRLLDYLGLPFDPACLRPHENKRAVRTASAEQVRQPINSRGMGVWQAYDPWLGPMKEALGPVLDFYPDVPAFD